MPDFIEQYESDNAVLGEQSPDEKPLEPQPQTLAQFIEKHQITLTSRFVKVEESFKREGGSGLTYAGFKWSCDLYRVYPDARIDTIPDISYTLGAAYLEYRGISKDWKRAPQQLTLGYDKKGKLCGLWREGFKTHLLDTSEAQSIPARANWVVKEAWSARTGMEKAGIKWHDFAGLLLRPQAPHIAMVLDSLASDASPYLNADSFEEFAREFGYDEDSRKAEAIYKACMEIGRKLERFLGRELLEELVYKTERL